MFAASFQYNFKYYMFEKSFNNGDLELENIQLYSSVDGKEFVSDSIITMHSVALGDKDFKITDSIKKKLLYSFASSFNDEHCWYHMRDGVIYTIGKHNLIQDKCFLFKLDIKNKVLSLISQFACQCPNIGSAYLYKDIIYFISNVGTYNSPSFCLNKINTINNVVTKRVVSGLNLSNPGPIGDIFADNNGIYFLQGLENNNLTMNVIKISLNGDKISVRSLSNVKGIIRLFNNRLICTEGDRFNCLNVETLAPFENDTLDYSKLNSHYVTKYFFRYDKEFIYHIQDNDIHIYDLIKNKITIKKILEPEYLLFTVILDNKLLVRYSSHQNYQSYFIFSLGPIINELENINPRFRCGESSYIGELNRPVTLMYHIIDSENRLFNVREYYNETLISEKICQSNCYHNVGNYSQHFSDSKVGDNYIRLFADDGNKKCSSVISFKKIQSSISFSNHSPLNIGETSGAITVYFTINNKNFDINKRHMFVEFKVEDIQVGYFDDVIDGQKIMFTLQKNAISKLLKGDYELRMLAVDPNDGSTNGLEWKFTKVNTPPTIRLLEKKDTDSGCVVKYCVKDVDRENLSVIIKLNGTIIKNHKIHNDLLNSDEYLDELSKYDKPENLDSVNGIVNVNRVHRFKFDTSMWYQTLDNSLPGEPHVLEIQAFDCEGTNGANFGVGGNILTINFEK